MRETAPRPEAAPRQGGQPLGALRRFGKRGVSPKVSSGLTEFRDLWYAGVWPDSVFGVEDYGTIRRWRRSDGEELPVIRFENDGSAFDVVGDRFIALASDESIWTVEAKTGKTRCKVDAEAGAVLGSVTRLGDGEHFAVVNEKLRVFDSQCDLVKTFTFSDFLYSAGLVPHQPILRLTLGDSAPDEVSGRMWHEDVSVGSWNITEVAGSATDEQEIHFIETPEWIVYDPESPETHAYVELAGGKRLDLGDGFSYVQPTIRWLLAPHGRTAVVFVDDIEAGETDGYVLSLPERTLRRRIELPMESLHTGIDPTGRWLTVTDEDTVLLYDLQ
ncbi:MAG: hypothetical protein ACRBN8_39810 [Nannocystales bacterium]